MNLLKKLTIILVANFFLFYLVDLLFGYFSPPPPEFLNTKSQYTSNYRNYFIEHTDKLGSTTFVVDKSTPVDLAYQRTNFIPNSLKVLAVGDSFTSGQGVKPQDTWIKQLEKLSPVKKLYGINYGQPGLNIKEISIVFNFAIKQMDPDLVVYAYVLNDPVLNVTTPLEIDIDNKNEYSGDKGIYYDLINFRTNVFDNNRSDLLNFLFDHFYMARYLIRNLEKKIVSEKTIKYYQDLHNPEKNQAGLGETFKLIKQMNDASLTKKGRFLVMIFPLFSNTQKNYPFKRAHDYLKAELTKRNIQTLDLLPYYSGIKDSDLWVHPIDQHPNDYAQGIAAKALKQWMLQNHFTF